MNKIIIKSIGLIGVLAISFYCYRKMVFTGQYDKKYSRDQLIQYFTEHENSFSDLVMLFNSKTPKNKKYTVAFGLAKNNKINLVLKPLLIDPASKIIGGENLELGDSKLDSALSVLGWTTEIVKTLRDKLSRTNCDWIRTTNIYGTPIELYPNQKGWGSFSYHIFEMPLSDDLIQIHGKSVSSSELGKRTFLDYSSAL